MSAQRVPVLMYHRVGTINDVSERKYCIAAERFAQHMHALADAGWHAVTIGDFFAWLNREAALTGKRVFADLRRRLSRRT
jgi:hypothetical protein